MHARNQRRDDRDHHLEYLDIAGWRVVELLTDSGCWHRYLAVAREKAALADDDWLSGNSSAQLPAAVATAPEGPVELVVEARSGPGLTLSELCELLEEVDAPSLPEILDIGMTEQQETVAVLEATTGSSVEELLDRPTPLTAGEIVTILAPIAETLAELHRHGVSLGDVTCADVRLTAAGRPVLKNWQTATRLHEVSGRAQASMLRDWKAFESVSDLVLAQLPSRTELPAGLERELDRCLSGDVDAQLGDRLLDALFAWQDAKEVHDPAAGDGGPRTALLAGRAPVASADRAEQPSAAGAGPGIRSGSLLNDESGSRATTLRRADVGRGDSRRRAQRARPRREAGPRFLTGIRLPYRVAAAAAVVMCVCAAAIGLLGGGGGGGEELSPGTAEIPVSALPSEAADTTAAPSSPAPAETAVAAPEATVQDWRALAASDDPTAAAMALVGRRAECLISPPSGCLEEIYQSDAPGLHVDLARPDAPGGALAELTSATLRDRYGDFAVVDLWPADAVHTSETPPASLTIARGEAGWRLRDVRVA